MTKDLGTSDAPAAARAVKPPWRDARLWIGVALVAGSIALGARVLAAADDTVRVWSAAADLQPGTVLTTADLAVVRVRLESDVEARYLRVGDELPAGGALVRAVGAGELVPGAAFGAAGRGLVSVPVSVASDAVPPSLAVGSVVDIWVSSGESGAPAARALDDVVVLELPPLDDLLGAAGDRQVVVGLPRVGREGVGDVLAASRDGRVSITVEG